MHTYDFNYTIDGQTYTFWKSTYETDNPQGVLAELNGMYGPMGYVVVLEDDV